MPIEVAEKGKTLQNFIGGKWVASASGRTKPNVNPANISEILGYYQESTRDDARKAIEAAKAAFPGWKKTPAPKRARVLYKMAELLTQRKEELARALTAEEGKCLNEALGEVQRAINVAEFTAAEGTRMHGQTIPSELPNNLVYTVRAPLGVVALITPWNFPVAIPVWKAAAALITGNTVVFKPSSLTPWTAAMVVEMFREAGLPAGVLNLVTGPGGEVGDELATNPDVAGISFTGSNEIGHHLAKLAGSRRAKIQLEMGGKNAIIVMDDAELGLAVNAAVLGAFGSTGQRCTATSRAIVQRGILPKFLEEISKKAAQMQVGPGKDSNNYVGPVVDENQLKKVMGYIEKGKQEGAHLALGGNRLASGEQGKGYFVEPTVFTKVKSSMTIAKEEIFGPVLSIFDVSDFEEALKIANDSPYGLSSSIFTRDVNTVFRYIDDIEVGIVHINSATIGGEAQVPFGGMKATGSGGREMGTTAIEFFTEWKSVYVDYTGESRTGNVY